MIKREQKKVNSNNNLNPKQVGPCGYIYIFVSISFHFMDSNIVKNRLVFMKTDKTSSDQNDFDGSQKTGLLDFLNFGKFGKKMKIEKPD
jgi:hypothetical protein